MGRGLLSDEQGCLDRWTSSTELETFGSFAGRHRPLAEVTYIRSTEFRLSEDLLYYYYLRCCSLG